MARILAKAVNCQNPKNGDCCLKCAMCLNFQASVPMDLVEIDAASNTGVDNIREIIEHARFRPGSAKRKVFIIDEVHMLSKGAFNALLKTLEEPPEHVIFILATTEINKVPATIISRTQRFDFARISEADISASLTAILEAEKFKLNRESVELISERAEGSLRDALSILDKVFTLGQNPKVPEVMILLGATDISSCKKLVDLIIKKDSEGVVAGFRELQEQGIDFAVFNKDILEYFRKMLVFKLSNANSELDKTRESTNLLQEQANKFSIPDLMRTIRLFLRSYKELNDSPSPELPLLLAGVEASMKSEDKTKEAGF